MTRLPLTCTCVVLGLLALAAAGCTGNGGGEDRARTGAAPAKPTSPKDPNCGAVPAAISGQWRVNIDPDDVPPEIADMGTGPLPMALGPGHRAIFWGGEPRGVDHSPVCVVGDRIRFAYDTCEGNEGPGIYTWRLDDAELVFKKVYDNCPYRAFHMTVHPWKREGSG
jgi:hypothetical protein